MNSRPIHEGTDTPPTGLPRGFSGLCATRDLKTLWDQENGKDVSLFVAAIVRQSSSINGPILFFRRAALRLPLTRNTWLALLPIEAA